MLAKGRHAASTAARARILLKADESEEGPGWTDGDIVRALDTSLSTAHRIRQEFVGLGLEAALYRHRPTGRQYRKLDAAPNGCWKATSPVAWILLHNAPWFMGLG
ncbi:MAG: helix-turn-helix domain-containing protein [Proteobacteria bacterium]|nr:helix-turn-helix domain-containing protein [Pseudomonadota bacterium]